MFAGFNPYPPVSYGSVSWMPAYNGQIPPGAEPAGRDQDGSPLYAGRARHENDLLPAKIKPNHHGAWVAWGGGEHFKHDYEVLVSDNVAWKYARDGRVHHKAVSVGNTVGGEPLYLGRAYYQGSITPGKVQPSHGCLYISFGGREISIKEYEVLINV